MEAGWRIGSCASKRFQNLYEPQIIADFQNIYGQKPWGPFYEHGILPSTHFFNLCKSR